MSGTWDPMLIDPTPEERGTMTPDAPRTERGAFLDAHIDEWLRLSAIPDNRALWNVRLDAKTSLALLDRLREAEAVTPADSLDALWEALDARAAELLDGRTTDEPYMEGFWDARATALRAGQRSPRNDEPECVSCFDPEHADDLHEHHYHGDRGDPYVGAHPERSPRNDEPEPEP